jgi:formyl-CoA transferase
MSFTPASKALARFKVLDLTRVRAGPTAARQFADWGADVIKIELPRGLDESDMSGPRHGPDFQNLHRNKRSLTLNLKEADGIAIFRRMVKTADVVIENYRPDVKFRLGIDYESVRSINKRIVYGSISGFGEARLPHLVGQPFGRCMVGRRSRAVVSLGVVRGNDIRKSLL